MRFKVVVVLSLVLLLPVARAADSGPVDCTHLLAWLAAGVSTQKLIQVVRARGVDLVLKPELESELVASSASAGLLGAIRSQKAVHQSSCPAPLVKAAEAVRHRNYEQAAELIEPLTQSVPRNGALHFLYGFIHQQQGDWDGAFDEFSASKEGDPGFAEVHNRLALIFYQADDGDNTIGEARTALSMDFQDAEAYRMLGLGHYANEQYTAAMNAFQESLERDPEDPDVYFEMGLVARDQGSAGQAIEYFHKSLQMNSRLWQAHSSLGGVLGREQRFNEAIAELRTAKRLAPNEPTVREDLARTYYNSGDYDAAIAEYSELFHFFPGSHGHDGMARAYLAKNQPSPAIAELKVAIQQDPTNATAHRALGQLLLASDHQLDAKRELQIAVELDPDSATSHYYLGTVLLQLQQLPPALKEFQESVRLEPTAEHHFALAACLMNMGRDSEALSEMETASRLDPEKRLYSARKDELERLMHASGVQSH